MFLSRNKKNNVYPCKPQFYYIKVGFKGVKIIQVCFRDDICAKSNKSILLPVDVSITAGRISNNIILTQQWRLILSTSFS